MLLRIRDELKELSAKIHKSEEKTEEQIKAIVEEITGMSRFEFSQKFEHSGLEDHIISPYKDSDDGLYWSPEHNVYVDVTFYRDYEDYPISIDEVFVVKPKITVKAVIEFE